MAASRKPLYTRTVRLGRCKVDTAGANFDGSNNVVTLIDNTSGGLNKANGIRIRYFTFIGIGTTGNELIKLYQDDGTTKSLWKSKKIAAATPSTTVEAAEGVLPLPEPFVLPNGYKILAQCHNGEDFWCYAYGADFEDAT